MTARWLRTEDRVLAYLKKGSTLARMADKTKASGWRWWLEPQGKEIDADIAEAMVKEQRVEAADGALFGDCGQSFVIRRAASAS